MTRACRIGAGAGFSADRWEPAVELIRTVPLDAIVFECLAERTIALGQIERLANPDKGHDPFLVERFSAVLPEALPRGVKIVTNMGAANPLAAAIATRDLAARLGLPVPRVAIVVGDDVLALVRAEAPPLDGGRALAEIDADLVSANAYLGARAIADALATGADIVITGRVADPSLFLGTLIHHHGWADDDWDRLAAGTLLGHLLECAGQVTGGYHADPGFVEVPDLDRLGFPHAVVEADGRARLGKAPGSGGRLDLETVRAQMFYEVHDPTAYVTPDVVADFSVARLERLGPDMVEVSGARGRPRPATLKVTVCAREGFVGEGQIAYAGLGALARARLAADIVRRRLATRGLAIRDLRADLLGVTALHGPASLAAGVEPAEVVLRVVAACADERSAILVGQEVQSLLTNGPAAGGGDVRRVRPILGVHSALLARDLVPHRVEVLA